MKANVSATQSERNEVPTGERVGAPKASANTSEQTKPQILRHVAMSNASLPAYGPFHESAPVSEGCLNFQITSWLPAFPDKSLRSILERVDQPPRQRRRCIDARG